MKTTRLFDAHAHLQNYPDAGEMARTFERGAAEGVAITLCNGTNPGDWDKVLALASVHSGVLPFFGLHPWFAGTAAEGWLDSLEALLNRVPSGVGEIGLDKAVNGDFGRQEDVFRAQLKLSGKLERPAAIHCVQAWGRLEEILKEERPTVFMLHAYGGSPELMEGLACLGAYFSFNWEVSDPRREKMRKALKAAPPERLLFETEAPGPMSLAEIIRASAAILGRSTEDLEELAWRNAEKFLGRMFPKL